MALNLKRFISIKYYYRTGISKIKKYFPRFYNKYLPFEDMRLYYLNRTNKFLSFSHPHNISEKLLWIARYWNDPLIVECADKYLMKKYIGEHGYSNLLIPQYGVYDNANDIDFEALPQKFVLKCNHGCGYNIICKDKSKLDREQTKALLNKWMSEKYGYDSVEYHYLKITPKIICEQYIDSLDGKSLIDYKMHCINGEPQFILVCTNRDTDKHTLDLTSYSLNWERLPYLRNEGTENIPRPAYLDEMIEYAAALAKPFPYVRVDFYYINNTIYIGELTFTPAGNIMSYYKDSTLDMMGNKLTLPPKKNEGYFRNNA